MEDILEDGFQAAEEEFYGDDHQDQAHDAHQNFIAAVAKKGEDFFAADQHQEGQDNNGNNTAAEDHFLVERVGAVHEDNDGGDGAGTADDGDCEGCDGHVAGIGIVVALVVLNPAQAGIQHFITEDEEDNAAHDAHAVNGDGKEIEQ